MGMDLFRSTVGQIVDLGFNFIYLTPMLVRVDAGGATLRLGHGCQSRFHVDWQHPLIVNQVHPRPLY